jgi:hypothetical protein
MMRSKAAFFCAALSGPAIDLAFGHLGQFLVRRLLLNKRLVEKRRGVIAAQLPTRRRDSPNLSVDLLSLA